MQDMLRHTAIVLFSSILYLLLVVAPKAAEAATKGENVDGYDLWVIGMDCLGHDVVPPTKTADAISCGSACNLQAQCTSFVYYFEDFAGVYNGTAVNREAGSCFLKDDFCSYDTFASYVGPYPYLKELPKSSSAPPRLRFLPFVCFLAVAGIFTSASLGLTF